MPKFNREKLVVKLLRDGRAVLIQRSLDDPGVRGAGRRIGEALEHPFGMRWDPVPPDPRKWEFDRQLIVWRLEAEQRHKRKSKP
jgi:hypothetical protein